MKIVSYLNNINEIEEILKSQVSEIIIGANHFSRFGKLSTSDAEIAAAKLKQHKIKTVFEWDILMTESQMDQKVKQLEELNLDLFDCIRVQDPGAYQYCIDELQHPIQLVLETGNHNLKGINTWIDLGDKRVERVALSSELPKEVLQDYSKEISCEIEVLGLGRILLFYSPRSLVKKYGSSEYLATSEESPHAGFPVVENQHGTFMFHIRDFCLLEQISEIKEMGIDFFRVDLRFEPNLSLLSKISRLIDNINEDDCELIKKSYSAKVIRGFYQVNKSDVLFKKLKNKHLKKDLGRYLGEIVAVKKKEYMGISIKQPDSKIGLKDRIEIRTPDGKIKQLDITQMKNASWNDIKQAQTNDVFFVPHLSGISIKSAVFRV